MKQQFSNYATEAAFNTYIEYLALKKHFSSKTYDYFKYNGKVKASYDKFKTRSDVFYFYKISQRKDIQGLFLSNLIIDPSKWIRDFIEDTAEEIYLKWKGRQSRLTYLFTSELSILQSDYKSNFIVKDGQYPFIITLYLQRKLSPETFSLLTTLSNIFPYWETNLCDKIILDDKINIAKKYFDFLDIDRKKYSDLIKEHFAK